MVVSEFDRLASILGAKELELVEMRSQMGPVHEDGGGWHDNAGFDQLKREERDLSTSIVELRTFLDECEALPRKSSYTMVEIGSIVTVTLHLRSGETELSHYLVAGDRRSPLNSGDIMAANPDAPFSISTGSPLGKLLLGAKVGEKRHGMPPLGVYTVISID